MNDISNAQRAFWSFLITTLAAPFFAALIVFLISAIAGALGKGPDSLKALDSTGQFAWAGEKAVSTFVWSALPAGLASAALAVAVYLRGSYSWLLAALAGFAAGALGALYSGGLVAQHGAAVAVIGGLTGILIWLVLRRSRILAY